MSSNRFPRTIVLCTSLPLWRGFRFLVAVFKSAIRRAVIRQSAHIQVDVVAKFKGPTWAWGSAAWQGVSRRSPAPALSRRCGGLFTSQHLHRDLKKLQGKSLNSSREAAHSLKVRARLWHLLPYAWDRTFFFPFAVSLSFLLVSVKGCKKAARHNEPSAQLTGTSAETFPYDIVTLLCNQSLLIWDTIAFSRPRQENPIRFETKEFQNPCSTFALGGSWETASLSWPCPLSSRSFIRFSHDHRISSSVK